MLKNVKKCISGILAAVLLVGMTGCAVEAKDPIAITVWHYYNGVQQQTFEDLVASFNNTVGADQGIVVTASSKGEVNELKTLVNEALGERLGAENVPDIFAAYADTAYEVDKMGKLADLSQYLTEEEQSAYVTSYLEEGRFTPEGGLKIFPTAKSTELLMVNKTAWDAFAAATAASQGDLSTWEGIAAVSKDYYNWTDAQTPDVAEDGLAFFGRDAFANYMLVGSAQLGAPLVDVVGDKGVIGTDETMLRRLWDNYYVPYINGYFGSYNRFRSDDIRTGQLAAMVCASTGATYFPGEVTWSDGSSAPIEGMALPLPNFAGCEPLAVQQGAGMVVTKTTPEREKAAVTFLKWFTLPENNLRYAIATGYLPVTYAAHNTESLLTAVADENAPQVLVDSLRVNGEMMLDYQRYYTKAFPGSSDCRTVINTSMSDWATADREAILQLMAQGVSRADAVAQYDTDENFAAWASALTTALAQIIG